ncbi:P-loop NTPase fold protein [Rhodococcus globerulus]|uniref:YobI family P-loop NTPase n=1 Tax=Rhodococcus globerulus TaxID=33008 RepID=UPI001C596D58|nr:P-loop NTPase fold protein [Rhodococcus globerulus]QXW02609.1 hypothetical protein KYT97_00280 [Rhodococcus globerulus]
MTSSSVALTSLTPKYEEVRHKAYLDRLQEVVLDSKNLNIALTGRYGSGKSSVLDKFEENNKSTTLRLAISTLGPNEEAATPTNRIQKELVKQLVYSASPKTLRHSRFRRSVSISWKQALAEVSVATLLLGALLMLLGWLPEVSGTSADHHPLVRVLAWVGLAALLIVVGTTLRMMTHDKFVVSDVSAGGATVTLSELTPTYFDEYLDDIVNYFDAEDIDIVIFEDLDRFDDPHIFEALRELNTLLNNTKVRIAREEPLRFVYAVRDSLFEKLGADLQPSGDDAAVIETVHANRTKFFDVVIPVVPFISHRNARDLLTDLLEEAGITEIDRPLVSLVAQHSTDMRLLRNMRNEYLVFSERLLESGQVAPGLTPSNLFALVAYKNFHLGDFENISRRTSDLDALYDFRRVLVADSIASLERRKRFLASGREKLRMRTPLAQELGKRLHALAEVIRGVSQFNGWPRLDYKVAEREFTSEQIDTYDFWQAIAEANELHILVSHLVNSSGQLMASISRTDLISLMPEGFESGQWDDIDEEHTRSKLAEIDRDIAFLRAADFSDLANTATYTVPVPVPVPVHVLSGNGEDLDVAQASTAETLMENQTFAKLIERVMKSALARELVNRGYVDRNFALYSAQFYGNFTGTDVANFIIQHVETDTMEVGYQLDRPGAVVNLLEEAGDDFTETVVAYNTDVVNHLLATSDPRANNVVNRVVTNFDDNARTFLSSYFTSGTQREKLASCMASHPWRQVFAYLSGDDGVPADVRPILVDAALKAVGVDQHYYLPIEVGDFIVEHYRSMSAFTQPQDAAVTGKVATVLGRANVHVPEIDALDSAIRELVVSRNLYELTARNLRTAIDPHNTGSTRDISFDRVIIREDVYEFCVSRPADYLTVVEQDDATPYIIGSPQTLARVLSSVVDVWSDEHLVSLTSAAAPESRLSRLSDAPTSTWPILADARLFHASLSNLDAYCREIGTIDAHLAGLLEDAGTIATADLEDDAQDSGESIDTTAIVIAILNAHNISSLASRISLVRSIDVDLPLIVGEIEAEASDLLAELIRHGIVPDEFESFAHFYPAGWAAIGPAIAISDNIASFLTPGLVHGMIADIFSDAQATAKVGRKIMTDVAAYVPEDDSEGLNAVAKFASDHTIPLTPQTVLRLPSAGASNQGRILRLLQTASPSATAGEIVAVFSALGGEYSKICRSGAEFTVPNDTVHSDLLTVLERQNVCTFRKKRSMNLYSVTVS